MQDILRELLKSHAHVVAGHLALWFLLGVLGGLLGGALAFLVLQKTGALECEGRAAAWCRAASAVLVIAAGAFFGGAIGGCEGTLRGTETVVRESQFRTHALRKAGEATAVSLFWCDLLLDNHLTRKDLSLRSEQTALLEEFVKSSREFDVAAFRERMTRTESDMVAKVADSAGAGVRAKLGLAAGGMADLLLGKTLTLAVDFGMKKKVRNEIEKHGLADGVDGLSRALDQAAGAGGAPTTATLPELTEAIVDLSLIPLIVTPAKTLARSSQTMNLLLMLAGFVLPALGFWVGRRIRVLPPTSASAPTGP